MKTKGYVEGGFRFFFINEKEKKTIQYHHHNFHKCLIVYEGDVTYTIEGQDHQLSKGSILWVPAYEMHRVQIRDQASYKRCVVYLSEDFVRNLGSGQEESLESSIKNSTYGHELSKSDLEDLLNLFPYDYKDLSSLGRIGRFIQFVDRYFRLSSDYSPEQKPDKNNADQLISGVMKSIRKQISGDLKIDQLAHEHYVSKYYLMHRFKEVTGQTIHQFMIRERLKMATSLMKKGTGLTESAYESGFKNYTTFARCFKQVYHMSPRDYLKMHPIRLDSWKE